MRKRDVAWLFPFIVVPYFVIGYLAADFAWPVTSVQSWEFQSRIAVMLAYFLSLCCYLGMKAGGLGDE